MSKLKEKLKNLDRGTLFRVLALALAIVNQIIAVAGANSFASSTVYQVISVSATVIVSLAAAWENNDFTGFARLATKVLDALEDGKITPDEVMKLFSDEVTDENGKPDEK